VIQQGVPTFLDPSRAPKLTGVQGLETAILTGLHGESMMMVLNTTQPGHTIATHSHPHEQLGVVLAGKATLRIGDEERVVEPGDTYFIPSNAQHSNTCLGDEPSVMLDVFCPVREDFIEKVKAASPA
jgi:quercetin dioxygenase-like cupin family protein